MKRKLKLREMVFADIEQVLAIEKAAFATPWTHEAFLFEMEQNEHAFYVVGELDGEIIGYCGSWLVMDQATITNIAITPQYHGRKLGAVLLGYVLQALQAAGATDVSLEVRVSNERAQQLYRKFAFVSGGIRKGYYVDNHEDALVMWRKFE